MSAASRLNFLFLTLFFAFLYVLVAVFVTNPVLIKQTIFGSYSLTYKSSLLFSLILGLKTSTSGENLSFLIIISFLTGANLAVLLRRQNLFKNMHFAAAGTLLGTTATGCVSCGVPLLGVLGLSGSIIYLPFHGLELSILSVLLLVFSLIYFSKNTKKSCTLNIHG